MSRSHVTDNWHGCARHSPRDRLCSQRRTVDRSKVSSKDRPSKALEFKSVPQACGAYHPRNCDHDDLLYFYVYNTSALQHYIMFIVIVIIDCDCERILPSIIKVL